MYRGLTDATILPIHQPPWTLLHNIYHHFLSDVYRALALIQMKKTSTIRICLGKKREKEKLVLG